MIPDDTIVALSSATPGDATPAARVIVRLSGPLAAQLVRPLASDFDLLASCAHFDTLKLDDLTFRARIYTFRAPHSYTGDDLIELHLPGNLLLARLLIEHFIAAGARQAEPGEFTARAFFNRRLDLAAAEGVSMAVSARQEGELRAARQLLSGELARRLQPHLDLLAATLALVETGIDFSDQDVTFIKSDELRQRAVQVSADLEQLVAGAAQIERLGTRVRFVLMGSPNAGKSTLLNALADHERAIVSPVAGTTRDALSAEVTLRRGTVEVIDVAGLEPTHDDAIARQMQHHAGRAIEEAEFVIHVIDGAVPNVAAVLPRDADLTVVTKADLGTSLPRQAGHLISARRGDGIDALRDAMDAAAFGDDLPAARVALNARHRDAIARTLTHLAAAAESSETAELAAHDLRAALDALGEVIGQVSPDDVLGRVFATFCIGK